MGVGFLNRKTPGVYVTELQAFPESMVGVPTAVPAFIGYTKKAEVDGKSAFNEPIRIGSMVEFRKYFGDGPDIKYKLIQKTTADLTNSPDYDFSVVYTENPSKSKNTDYYSLDIDTNSKPSVKNFYLYNSVRIFYENGGGDCYVVSVGDYSTPLSLKTLNDGLETIHNEKGPTMLVMPDAVLLDTASGDFKTIANNMLKQAKELQDRVAILDVPKALLENDTSSDGIENAIDTFRGFLEQDKNSPSRLSYGIAYYPWLNTNIITDDEISFTTITNTDLLKTVLENSVLDKYNGAKLPTELAKKIEKKFEKVKTVIDQVSTVKSNPDSAVVEIAEQNIITVAPLLKDILTIIKDKMNVLPPSGAVAGVISNVDSTSGVWKAPANVNLNSVVSPNIKITNEEQEDMNVPIDGMAVNAIRTFAESGVVIWGARTLDGNSKDWRYVNIRRTLIYIEQSIKQALRAYLFDPNDASTWTAAKSMISGWLSGLWEQGGLMGDKANAAFDVQVGLGSTMTPSDILDGYMIVQVQLQMIHPVEFIELTFKQEMNG